MGLITELAPGAMDKNGVQPPRYTSTPRAGRNMVSLLNNFIEVSPIFPTPDNARKAKSMIPVVTTNGIRSNGVRSVGAKTKFLMSTNSTGQGSSGSVKIPSHIPKAAPEKKIDNVKVPMKSAAETLPQVPKTALQNAPRINVPEVSTKNANETKQQVPEEASARNSVDEVIDCVIKSLPQKETKPSSLDAHTQVSTKNANETKQQVPEEASARNSVDEVIDCVIKSLPQKETKPSSLDPHTQDDSRTTSHTVSKRSQRPSTLPSVPEEPLNEGTGQLTEDCIFKKSVKTQSGWLIPKETKIRVSLKRKSSVPCTVTKRNKRTVANFEANDESLFDSPELPNLVEVSSLCNKRQTYVLKTKPEISIIEEEHHKNITDGIIPLENLRQESPLCNTSVKGMHGDLKKKAQETETRNSIRTSEQTASKNNLKEMNKSKENTEHSDYVSPKVYKGKRTLTKQPKIPLKQNGTMESFNSKTESIVNSVETKPSETNQETGQKEIEPGISEKEFKELNVNNHQSKETIPIKDLNDESPKKKTVMKRILRERKPNLKYNEKSEISFKNVKGVSNKNKKEPTVKLSLEGKDNLNEPPVKSKLVRKKAVKGNKKPTGVNSVPDELPLCGQNGVLEEVTNGNLNSLLNQSKTHRLKKFSEKQNETTSVPEGTKGEVKCPDKGNKKEKENKRKTRKLIKESSQIPAKDEEKIISCANKPDASDITQNLQLPDINNSFTSKPNVIKKKAPLEKQTSPVQNEAYQGNGDNEGSHKAGTLIYDENLQFTSNRADSSKPSNNNQMGSDNAPETKNRRKTVQGNAKAKHEKLSMKPSEQGMDGNGQSTRGEKGKTSVEENTTNKIGSDISPETKKRRTVPDNAIEENLSVKPADKGIEGNDQARKGGKSKKFEEENEKITMKTISTKHSSKSQSIVKTSDVCEQSSQKQDNRNTLNKYDTADDSSKGSANGNCPETETCVPSTRKKRKSKGMYCEASHSGPKTASKRRRCDDPSSENVNNAEKQYNINDLFGMNELEPTELQPGVVAHKSIHIHNFLMAGEVHLVPGASLNKISTNTTYLVLEGTAQVRIQQHRKTFNGNDKHRRFFIPKGIDVSITNVGNLPLKMEFSKFRG